MFTSPKVLSFDIICPVMENLNGSTRDSSIIDLQKNFEEIKITSTYETDDLQEANSSFESSNTSSILKDKPLIDFVDISAESHLYLSNFELSVSNPPKQYYKKSVHELNKYSLKQLQVLLEDLSQHVEQVSSELVQLLLENDSLQQESDARNIMIEQLLKMTVKDCESDLKPIQMSVILPHENCDDV